jgi:hypothetical protein
VSQHIRGARRDSFVARKTDEDNEPGLERRFVKFWGLAFFSRIEKPCSSSLLVDITTRI